MFPLIDLNLLQEISFNNNHGKEGRKSMIYALGVDDFTFEVGVSLFKAWGDLRMRN